ncbi:MAG: hypothetical protein JSR46_01875 [Verrucomicrobia bacterium]|nr:hypothetical protein [Verrucomicrobiota bacterium]
MPVQGSCQIARALLNYLVENRYRRPIESMPFAHTLYLICLSVGAGGFQEALKKMQSKV